VGIVGCGRIGRVHLTTLKKLRYVDVRIVADYFLEAAESAADEFGIAEAVQDADTVLNHPDLDAVWICSPSRLHAEQIRAAATAGKHVFCEKPLGTDLAESIEVVKYCEEQGVQLMTALQRRFDPAFRRIHDAVADGEVGEPVQLRITSRDPAPPPLSYVEGSGGLFKDMAVHDLDMSCFLLGREPLRVFATGGCHVDPNIRHLEGAEAFDTANILVDFEGGVVASIDVCRKAVYGYDQRAELLGTEGMMQSENLFPTTVRKATADWFGHADKPHDFFMNRYAVAYETETAAFARAITDGAQVPVDGWDGVRSLRLALAAEKSALEGRWVDIDEITH